jgi:hypothetical protein
VGRIQLSAAGRRNKLLGMMGLVGGIVGTLLSMFVIDSERGTVYCVAATIIGLGMFLKDSAQLSRNRKG